MAIKTKTLLLCLFGAFSLLRAFAQGETIQAVDLGLSVKWANMNVNASKDIEPGVYCGWGDPDGEKTGTNGDYYTSSSFALSGSVKDIAKNKLGDEWRIPTKEEIYELKNNCLWIYQEKDNQIGYKVIGPNGNSIFMPIAGYREGTYIRSSSEFTYYRIGTEANSKGMVRCLYLDSCTVDIKKAAPHIGTLIRPVQDTKVRESSGVIPTELSQGDFIDMGLSVKWASANLGATKPEEAGDHYQWASIEKDALPLDVGWESEERAREKREIALWKQKLNSIEKTSYDVAFKLGKGRMPTYKEMLDLRRKCSWVWSNYKGVEGYRVFARNGNSIFFPYAGVRYYREFTTDEGYYWTGTAIETGAYALILDGEIKLQQGGLSNNGTIRPVK